MKNQVTVITGASQGIGAATAKRLAKVGHPVVAIARNEEKLKHLCEEINFSGGQADYLVQDLSKTEELPELVDKLIAQFGSINSLVLNAGFSFSKLFEETNHEEREYEFKLNYFAPSLLIELLLPQMIKQQDAHIVAVGSLTGLIPFPGNANYAASKAALYTLFRNLRIELADQSIHVGMVLPGFTKTGLTKDLDTMLPASSPDSIAQSVHYSLKHNVDFTIPGLENNLIHFLERLDPRLMDKFTSLFGRLLVPGLDQSLKERSLQ